MDLPKRKLRKYLIILILPPQAEEMKRQLADFERQRYELDAILKSRQIEKDGDGKEVLVKATQLIEVLLGENAALRSALIPPPNPIPICKSANYMTIFVQNL